MTEEEILPVVKFAILTDDGPDILAIETHLFAPKPQNLRVARHYSATLR